MIMSLLLPHLLAEPSPLRFALFERPSKISTTGYLIAPNSSTRLARSLRAMMSGRRSFKRRVVWPMGALAM